MSRATGPEAVRAGKEVLLIHGLQHHDDRPLRQLVFEGRDVGGIMHLVQLALGMEMGRIGDPLLEASIRFIVDGDCIWGVRLALLC